MANSDKNIVITPSVGASAEPTIKFTGFSASSINLRVLDDATLSFEGTAGQLFSVSDGLSGTIFSVNDISGIPSIEVLDTGQINLAEFSGNVGVGTASPISKLHVTGSVTANQFIGSLDWTNVASKPAPVVGVNLTGDVTGAASATLTSLANGQISIATTVAANSVALGTDTTGNYVAGATGGTGITITGTAGEGWSPTISVDATASVSWANVSSKPSPIVGVSITGDVTGAASATLTQLTNGSIAITAAVVDDSHNHIISNVDNLQTELNSKAPLASASLTGTPTAPTATAGTNTPQIATTQFVRTEISNLVDSAPGTLDTLNELAAALGDDPNYAASTASVIATKLDAATASTLYVQLGGSISHANTASSINWNGVTNKPDPVIGVSLSGNTTGAASATLTDLANGQISITTNTAHAGTASSINWSGITGTATFPDGSAGAPSITNTGDNNTGIFFPEEDTIAFSEGGAEVMRINAAAQVVIPGGTSASPALTRAGGTTTGIFFPDGAQMAFSTVGTERWRIDSGGTFRSSTNVSFQPQIQIKNTNTDTSAGYLIFQKSPTDNTLVLNDILGNVIFQGIGTDGVDKTSALITAAADGPNTASNVPSSIRFSTSTGTTSTPERMRITSAGYVGIGTAAPAHHLEVSSGTAFEPRIGIRNTNTDNSPGYLIFEKDPSDNSITTNDTIGSIRWRATNTGNSQIDSAEIRVSADASNDATSTAGRMLFLTTPSGGTITERMRITSAGNVGIGTTNPNRTLSVIGTASFTGDVSAQTFSGLLLGNAMSASSINSSLITGTTLPAAIVNSSLTSVGTLTNLTVSGNITANSGTIAGNFGIIGEGTVYAGNSPTSGQRVIANRQGISAYNTVGEQLFFIGSASATSASPLLRVGTFDDFTVLDPPTASGWFTFYNSGTPISDSSFFHLGGRSMRWTPTANTVNSAEHGVRLTPGKEYTVSAWVYSASPLTDSRGNVGIWILQSSASPRPTYFEAFSSIYSTPVNNQEIDAGKWTNISGKFIAPTASFLSVSLRANTACAHPVWWDTVSLEETANTPQIAGFSFGAGSLLSNNMTLDSSGQIILGPNLNNVAATASVRAVGLSGVSGQQALWIGHQDPSIAPFKISRQGRMTVPGITNTANGITNEVGQITSLPTYNNAAALTPNMHVTATGVFRRDSSTQRVKNNIIPINGGELGSSVLPEKISSSSPTINYREILNITPVEFTSTSDVSQQNTRLLGFIAEDIADKIPEIATYDNEGIPDYFDIKGISAAILAVVQDQQKEIEQLKARIELLEK